MSERIEASAPEIAVQRPPSGISRRGFVGGVAAGLVLVIRPGALGALLPARATVADQDAVLAPSVYLAIEPSGTVRIVCHRSEMGQGVRTSMPMLVAEELGVSLDQVVVEQAEGDRKYGNQNTDGSTSVRLNWEPLRKAGAAAREMLTRAAAERWGVSAAECVAAGGRVSHGASGRSATYGELAAAASALDVPAEPELKSSSELALLGSEQTHVDAKDMVTGKAVYGIDFTLPGMLHASMERSPTVGGKVGAFDPAPALAVRGVKKVLALEPQPAHLKTFGGVVVVADSTWAALQGRKALDITWEGSASESSEELRKKLDALVESEGKPVRDEGDWAAAKAAAARVVSAKYHAPHLVHAPMEPLAATVLVKDGACEVWAPTQDPQTARQRVAAVVGLPQEKVKVNVTLLGGGFGRKSKPDFILEAAQVAKEMAGTPIKLTWSREDEIRHGYYRAQSAQKLEAAIDADGRVTGWRHHTAFPTITSTFMPAATEPSDSEVGMGATNVAYRFPAVRIEKSGIASDLRIGWLRSVCNTFHAVGVNCFFDELAESVGKDPVAYRLEMLGEPEVRKLGPRDEPYGQDTGRLARVIEIARDMGEWGKPLPDGVAQGFASHFSFLTYVAMALRASLDDEGKVRVHRVDCAVDCGSVVNLDTVRAQMEGGVVWGLSMALYGEVTARNGVVQQSNFHDFEVLRVDEMPEVRIHVVESTALPSGVGEPGMPPVAPALMNALYRLTGKRVYDLPLKNQGLA